MLLHHSRSNDEPSREGLLQEETALDVFVDQCSLEELCFYSPQDTTARRLAALCWLEKLRRMMEARDAHRCRDPLPRRRVLLWLLWRR
jgi:hypothetical protein